MHLTLTRKHPEAGNAVSFIFTPAEPLTWKAGQYLHLHLPHPEPDAGGVDRYFTIAAAPFEKHVQITTRITPSTFKQALNQLPLGSTLTADGPEGDFILEDPRGEYVFIAGGIGITPFRSILTQLSHEGKSAPILLLYGNRSPETTTFREELADLAAKDFGLRIEHILTPQGIGEVEIRRFVPDLQQPIFYVSGPEPMVESLEKTMAGMGIAEDKMIRDYFPGYNQSNF